MDDATLAPLLAMARRMARAAARRGGWDRDELTGAAYLGLARALFRWPSSGFRDLVAFANLEIRQEISNEIRAMLRRGGMSHVRHSNRWRQAVRFDTLRAVLAGAKPSESAVRRGVNPESGRALASKAAKLLREAWGSESALRGAA